MICRDFATSLVMFNLLLDELIGIFLDIKLR